MENLPRDLYWEFINIMDPYVKLEREFVRSYEMMIDFLALVCYRFIAKGTYHTTLSMYRKMPIIPYTYNLTKRHVD